MRSPGVRIEALSAVMLQSRTVPPGTRRTPWMAIRIGMPRVSGGIQVASPSSGMAALLSRGLGELPISEGVAAGVRPNRPGSRSS